MTTDIELCGLCDKPAVGYAKIGDQRYCHSDERSCYTKASRERTEVEVPTGWDGFLSRAVSVESLVRPPTLVDFLLVRIAEDEAAAAALESPETLRGRGPVAVNFAAHAERETRVPSVALTFACPTCHVEPGATCMAMTPPMQAPRPAAQFHGTRRDLARAEIRRQAGDVSHAARWNLRRVLAECAAKARIVGALGQVVDREWESVEDLAIIDAARYSLRQLASVYSDHPDYRDEWKP